VLTHRHHPVDGLAAGKELGLAQDRRSAAALVAPVTATLAFGFQPGRAADALDLVGGTFSSARCAARAGILLRVLAPATAAAAAFGPGALTLTTCAVTTGAVTACIVI